MALPFLPSLATPPRAYGATVVGANKKSFVAFCTQHGAIAPSNMYPLSSAVNKQSVLGGQVSFGPLQRKVQGNDAVISPTLTAPADVLTDRLVGKLLVQKGFDIPFYISHHTGGHLGNVAGNDGVAGGDQVASQKFPNPTIDQTMAWSGSFYPDLAGVRLRNIELGYGGWSYGYSSPTMRSGSILRNGRGVTSAQDAFTRIFGGTTAAGNASPVSTRKPIVDQVLAHWKSVRESNVRLSASDRQRMGDFMDRMSELQRSLKVTVAPLCTSLKQPATDTPGLNGQTEKTPSDSIRRFSIWNDVISAAILCGTTRIFVVSVHDLFMPFGGDWHQEVAHTQDQSKLVPSNRDFFRYGLTDLARKLDVDAGDGGTYLDRSLLHWSQESGDTTHHGMNQAIVSYGSAGGFFKTGQFVDWSNPTAAKINQYGVFKNPGILMNHWHANVMLGMGIPKADWPTVNNKGYGNLWMGMQFRSGYSAAAQAAMGDPLPIITGG